MLDFLAYLEFERGLSRNTLEAYRSDLLQFGEWLQRTRRDPLALDHAGLTQFVSELAEEIGKAASEWEHLHTFFTSPGFTDEVCHVYLATGLSDARAEADAHERIDIEVRPLAELDAIIDEVRDAKTLIGLLELRRRVSGD